MTERRTDHVAPTLREITQEIYHVLLPYLTQLDVLAHPHIEASVIALKCAQAIRARYYDAQAQNDGR